MVRPLVFISFLTTWFVVGEAFVRLPPPPLQRKMTLSEALAKELIKGDPEVCVGGKDMARSTTGYGCCHGTAPDSECYISTPDISRILKDWFRNDLGSPFGRSSWNPIVDGLHLHLSPELTQHRLEKRDVRRQPHDRIAKHYGRKQEPDEPEPVKYPVRDPQAEQERDPRYSPSKDVRMLDPAAYSKEMKEEAKRTTAAMKECNRMINEEVAELEEKARDLEKRAPEGYIPKVMDFCPTYTTITYPTVGHACQASPDGADVHKVHIAQGLHFLQPVTEVHCDKRKIKKSWIAQFNCHLNCHQVHRLEKLPAQKQNGTGEISWHWVIVASACKAVLDYSSPYEPSDEEEDGDYSDGSKPYKDEDDYSEYAVGEGKGPAISGLSPEQSPAQNPGPLLPEITEYSTTTIRGSNEGSSPLASTDTTLKIVGNGDSPSTNVPDTTNSTGWNVDSSAGTLPTDTTISPKGNDGSPSTLVPDAAIGTANSSSTIVADTVATMGGNGNSSSTLAPDTTGTQGGTSGVPTSPLP